MGIKCGSFLTSLSLGPGHSLAGTTMPHEAGAQA